MMMNGLANFKNDKLHITQFYIFYIDSWPTWIYKIRRPSSPRLWALLHYELSLIPHYETDTREL